MTIKRAPQVASTLTLEEHRRLVQAVTLLITVARRDAAVKRKRRTTGQDKKENGVRKIRGPCFFANSPYNGFINKVKILFNRKETNDKKFLYYNMFTNELQ